VRAAFGPGAAAQLQIVVPEGDIGRVVRVAGRDRGIAAVAPPERSGHRALITAVPASAPGTTELRATIDRLRRALPPKALVGGAAAENRDLERAMLSRLPLVIGLVVAVGFVLLAAVLRSPTAAAAAVALIGVLSAFVLLRESRRNVFDPRGRVSFMATSGLLASAVFLGLILMGGLGAVVLPECHQG
jgi:RND superfamily putative drug exporter